TSLWERLHPTARIYRLGRLDFLSADGPCRNCLATKAAGGRAAVSHVGLSDRADRLDVAGRIAHCRSCLPCADDFGNRNAHRVHRRTGVSPVAQIGSGDFLNLFRMWAAKYFCYACEIKET